MPSGVSDCLPRHGLQPVRLLRSWNFPGKILKQVAISSSKGSSQARDQTRISCIVRRILYHSVPGKPYYIASIGNYIQYLVLTCSGKESEIIYMHNWVTLLYIRNNMVDPLYLKLLWNPLESLDLFNLPILLAWPCNKPFSTPNSDKLFSAPKS